MLRRINDVNEILNYEGLYILNIDDYTVKIGMSTDLRSRLSSYMRKYKVAYIPCSLSKVRENVCLRYLKNILKIKPIEKREFFSIKHRDTIEKVISFFSCFSDKFITDFDRLKYETIQDPSVFNDYVIPSTEDDINYIYDDINYIYDANSKETKISCKICKERFANKEEIHDHFENSKTCMIIRINKAYKIINDKDRFIKELQDKIKIDIVGDELNSKNPRPIEDKNKLIEELKDNFLIETKEQNVKNLTPFDRVFFDGVMKRFR